MRRVENNYYVKAEHSGKWPKDEAAVRRLRVAWLNEVGKALSKKVEGLNQRLIGENLVVIPPSKESHYMMTNMA